MNHKAEIDEVGAAIARLVRKAQDYHRLLEEQKPAKEDPTRAKRAHGELEAVRELEKHFQKAFETFEKEDKHLAEVEKAAREKEEKDAEDAEKAAEKAAKEAAHPHTHVVAEDHHTRPVHKK